MERPLVSVLVLSRRRPDRLRSCLAGIALQDHPALEIHVLANGCPETAALIRDEYPDLRLHEETENIGCAPGRDRLVREARGEFVLFVDDDGELRSPDIALTLRSTFSPSMFTGWYPRRRSREASPRTS